MAVRFIAPQYAREAQCQIRVRTMLAHKDAVTMATREYEIVTHHVSLIKTMID